MSKFMKLVAAPGARDLVTRTATTALPETKAADQYPETSHEIIDERKSRLLDRWLDRIVAASGSIPVLSLVLVLLLVWALLGIPFGQSENWQVLISDVQALFCYLLDSLLMRQQLNAYDRDMRIVANLQSRSVSVRRMLHKLRDAPHKETPSHDALETQPSALPALVVRPPLAVRLVDMACNGLSHIITLIFFWICMVVWLAFGPYCSWSVRWQLYINSSTSALMILVFSLLACLREQHRKQVSESLKQISDLDAQVEVRLRELTDDQTPNPSITIYPAPVGRLERAISYYADLVGTLVGICLLMLVVVVWVVIGPALHFSSNWWLIIGTYAGLIGMHDGFVLHNIESQLGRNSRAALAAIEDADGDAMSLVYHGDNGGLSVASYDVEDQAIGKVSQASLKERIATTLSRLMAHPYAVLFGIFVILGLLVGASILKWSTTGQLLCNIPPSIVETFVMMVLITREKLDWEQEGRDWQGVADRRKLLLVGSRLWSGDGHVSDMEQRDDEAIVTVGERKADGINT